MARSTVGLLFSDIEGSTRLLQALGPAYGDVLLDHHRLLRSAFVAYHGTERGNEGDSFFVTFPTVTAAVGAALDAQRAVSAHPWPPGAEICVRMGLHVGEIEEVAGGVIGIAIHAAARISAAAHGGQVLASDRAAGLATPLPSEAGWRHLGNHRLKDLPEPVPLLQLTHPDLAAEFPPVRSQGSVRDNLPAQPTSFVGRVVELAEVRELLRGSRLLTLAGAGGSGKSRLALAVAAMEAASYAGGAWFIDLARVSDPAAVLGQVTASVGAGEVPLDQLCSALGDQRRLLLMDNCEHLIAATGDVVDELLRRCPGVTVLATSREPLGVPGEKVWRVPPLLPGDAAELLAERAAAVSSGFTVDDDNREAVAEVCRRLDAIPLALELAAARLTSLSVAQLAERLDQRFRLLSGGSRGGMERHRTLQATVDWSYDLLSADEQSMLRQLGVFVGGFSLDAVEAFRPDVDAMTALELVDLLVRKSLVIAEVRGGAVRYRLLETVRQYALDRLAAEGELPDLRRAHLRWVAGLAGSAGQTLWFGGDEATWLARLDDEDANLLAGLEWALDDGDVGGAVGVLFDVFGWLTARGRSREGLALARRVLAAGPSGADGALGAVLEMSFASNAGALEPAVLERVRQTAPLLAGSTRPWVELIARSYAAAWSYPPGNRDAAATAVGVCEQVAAAGAAYGPAVRTWLLQPLMWVHLDAEDLPAARRTADQGVAAAEEAGLSHGLSRMTLNRARIELRLGDLDAAWDDAERAARIARGTGEAFVAAAATRVLAQVAERRSDHRLARDLLTSILDAVVETHPTTEVAAVRADLERCAALAD